MCNVTQNCIESTQVSYLANPPGPPARLAAWAPRHNQHALPVPHSVTGYDSTDQAHSRPIARICARVWECAQRRRTAARDNFARGFVSGGKEAVWLLEALGGVVCSVTCVSGRSVMLFEASSVALIGCIVEKKIALSKPLILYLKLHLFRNKGIYWFKYFYVGNGMEHNLHN